MSLATGQRGRHGAARLAPTRVCHLRVQASAGEASCWWGLVGVEDGEDASLCRLTGATVPARALAHVGSPASRMGGGGGGGGEGLITGAGGRTRACADELRGQG